MNYRNVITSIITVRNTKDDEKLTLVTASATLVSRSSLTEWISSLCSSRAYSSNDIQPSAPRFSNKSMNEAPLITSNTTQTKGNVKRTTKSAGRDKNLSCVMQKLILSAKIEHVLF